MHLAHRGPLHPLKAALRAAGRVPVGSLGNCAVGELDDPRFGDLGSLAMHLEESLLPDSMAGLVLSTPPKSRTQVRALASWQGAAISLGVCGMVEPAGWCSVCTVCAWLPSLECLIWLSVPQWPVE